MTLMLSARTAPDALLHTVRDRLKDVAGGDPSAIVVTTLDEHLKRTALASERIAAVLVSVCAVLALMLGVLALYGAMSEAARYRQRDIALRLALGAGRWRIMRQVLGEGVRLAAAGTAAGMLGSMLVARWLAASMSSTATPRVWVWLSAPSALLAAVVIAGVLPLRRATAVNPAALLQRNET
jgi:ABC-type antimicrobial peptide transport system permease subunit